MPLFTVGLLVVRGGSGWWGGDEGGDCRTCREPTVPTASGFVQKKRLTSDPTPSTSACLHFCGDLGAVELVVTVGATHDEEAKLLAIGLPDEQLRVWAGRPFERLRGQVGGGTPILVLDPLAEVDIKDVDVEARDTAEPAGKELRSARGPRGGALPDITTQVYSLYKGRGREESEVIVAGNEDGAEKVDK